MMRMFIYLRIALVACIITPILTQFCFIPGGPPDHPCCDLPAVDNTSISESYTFKPKNVTSGRENASLDVIVTWEQPQIPDHTAFNVYGVCLLLSSSRPATPASGSICGRIDETCRPYINSVATEYTFEDVLFGHNYRFVIRLANWNYEYDALEYRAALETQMDLETTPDCYETTQDLTFCERQPIEISSKPTEFLVHGFVRIDNTLADAIVSWRQPVQINQTERLVSFRVSVTTIDGEHISEKKVNVNQVQRDGGLNTSYTLTLSELFQNTSYSVQIEPAISFEDKEYPRAGFTGSFEMDVPFLEAPPTTFPPPQPNNTEVIPAIPPSQTFGTLEILIIASCAGVAVILTVIVIAGVIVAKRSGPEKEDEFEPIVENSGFRKKSLTQLTGIDKPEVDPRFADYEMERSRLKVEDKLGSGQFGIVYKAFALGIGGKGKDEYTAVAVKSLKASASRVLKEEFLDEIERIIDIGKHPNITTIIGCVTVDEPYYLVTEFMKYGDLQNFLMKCREEENQTEDPIYNLTDTNQIQIAVQIARGMEYLSHTRYYHGDLAARNILVDEGLIVKLSDFGMAEDIYERGYKRMAAEKKRPVKWVSLETNQNGKCSIESDVWSYGIVLFEIYTLGGNPYPNIDGRMVLNWLEEGNRMDKPDACPNDVYDIMRKCWLQNPAERPTFEELHRYFDDKLVGQAGYLPAFGEREYDVFEATEPNPDDANPSYPENPNPSYPEMAGGYASQLPRQNTYVDMANNKPQASRQISSEYLVMRQQNSFGIDALLNTVNAAINPAFARDESLAGNTDHHDTYM